MAELPSRPPRPNPPPLLPQNGIGAVPSPMDCYLALRGLKTLHLRMERHAANAQALAEALEAHPAVERVRRRRKEGVYVPAACYPAPRSFSPPPQVLYPGLASHPQHALAVRQTRGHSGMVTFYVRGGLPAARAFLESTKVRESRSLFSVVGPLSGPHATSAAPVAALPVRRVARRRRVTCRVARHHDARVGAARAARAPRHLRLARPLVGRC